MAYDEILSETWVLMEKSLEREYKTYNLEKINYKDLIGVSSTREALKPYVI